MSQIPKPRRARALLPAGLLIFALAAATGLVPPAQADPSTATWTCHADATASGCPANIFVTPGDTLHFHYHGLAGTFRWAYLVDSTLPSVTPYCVPHSLSGGGAGTVTLLVGHVYAVYWSELIIGTCTPLTPPPPVTSTQRVPDLAIPLRVIIPVPTVGPIGPIDIENCFNDPTPQYDEICIGEHPLEPGCTGYQRNEYNDQGELVHRSYGHICEGPGDLYFCSGNEYYSWSEVPPGFAEPGATWGGRYEEDCLGMLDFCVGSWHETGTIDVAKRSRIPTSREWGITARPCV